MSFRKRVWGGADKSKVVGSEGDSSWRGAEEAALDQQQRQGYKGMYLQPESWMYGSGAGQQHAKALQALQAGFSGTSDEMLDLQDVLMKAANERVNRSMQGKNSYAEENKKMIKADLEQAFANQGQQMQRGMAGTGAGASLGYGRQAGAMANDYQNNLARQLLAAEQQGQQQMGQDLQLGGSIGDSLFQQELSDRQHQLEQMQNLANMYEGYSDKEAGRASEESARAERVTAARKQAQAQILSGLMNVGMTAATGGMGGGGLLGPLAGAATGAVAPTKSPVSVMGGNAPWNNPRSMFNFGGGY